MTPVISVGNNIYRLRKEARLTQEDLASYLGVTKASVSKWETGQSYPDIELLPKMFIITFSILVFPYVILVGGGPSYGLAVVGHVGGHQHAPHSTVFGESSVLEGLRLLLHPLHGSRGRS